MGYIAGMAQDCATRQWAVKEAIDGVVGELGFLSDFNRAIPPAVSTGGPQPATGLRDWDNFVLDMVR
jgi:hypothetical protein